MYHVARSLHGHFHRRTIPPTHPGWWFSTEIRRTRSAVRLLHPAENNSYNSVGHENKNWLKKRVPEGHVADVGDVDFVRLR